VQRVADPVAALAATTLEEYIALGGCDVDHGVALIDREYEAAVAAGAILSGSERVAADIALGTQRLLADCDHSLEELAADPDLAWMVTHDLFLAAYEAGERAATPDLPAVEQQAFRSRADALTRRINVVRVGVRRARHLTPRRPLRRRGLGRGLRSGRPAGGRRTRTRGSSRGDPDPASDEPPAAAARSSSFGRTAA
jgi:hypothetical protein